MTALIFTGDVEDKLQRLQWIPRLSTWRPFRFCECFSSRLAVVFAQSIDWSQLLSREWRCSWSSADRRYSNYIWVSKQCYCLQGCDLYYIRGLTVSTWDALCHVDRCYTVQDRVRLGRGMTRFHVYSYYTLHAISRRELIIFYESSVMEPKTNVSPLDKK